MKNKYHKYVLNEINQLELLRSPCWFNLVINHLLLKYSRQIHESGYSCRWFRYKIG